jgi:hypothetical protein
VRGVRARDRLEAQRHVAELSFTEPAGEVVADPTEMGEGGMPRRAESPLREAGPCPSAIHGIREPLDQALRCQSVDQAGQAAGGQEHALRQVAHPKRAVRGTCQPDQNVVLAHGQPVRLLEFALQPGGDLVMRVQEGLPGALLGIAEPGPWHGGRVPARNLQTQRSG